MTAQEAYKRGKINHGSLVKYKNKQGHYVYGKIFGGYEKPDFQKTYNVSGKDINSDELIFPEYDDDFYILEASELVPLKEYEFQKSYSNDWVVKTFIGCTPWPNGTAKYVALDDRTSSHINDPTYYSYARLPLEERIKNRVAEISPGKEDEIAELVRRFKDDPSRHSYDR